MSTIPTLCLLPLLWLLAGGQSSADAGSIAGQVVDSDSGALIAAARVLLYIPTPGPDGVALVPHETVSDEAGTFQYVGVEPGHYQISAIKEDYIRPNGSRQAEFVEVSGDRGPVEVVYHLRRSAVISGRVFDLAGQPASRATVMALHARRTESDFKNATPAVRTDQDGRFRLTGLDDGQYLLKAWLEAEREAGGPTVLISITYYAGALDVEAATSMTIAAGQILDNVDFGLAAPALFELSGIVVGATGEPVANATVLVTPNHSGAEPPVSVPDRVKTAADGTFVIRQVARGDYVLRAAAPVVSPSSNPDLLSSHYVASSPAAQGGPLLSEATGGLTTEYRFDPVGVALSVRDQSVPGIRLIVSR